MKTVLIVGAGAAVVYFLWRSGTGASLVASAQEAIGLGSDAYGGGGAEKGGAVPTASNFTVYYGQEIDPSQALRGR